MRTSIGSMSTMKSVAHLRVRNESTVGGDATLQCAKVWSTWSHGSISGPKSCEDSMTLKMCQASILVPDLRQAHRPWSHQDSVAIDHFEPSPSSTHHKLG